MRNIVSAVPGLLAICLGVYMLAADPTLLLAAESSRTGEQIYRTRCAVCHGPRGEGTEKHADRLAGDLPVVELAGLIQETMPEDDPGSLNEVDAQSVAGYIHGAFYSPIAQARNQPARINMARLTVRQYRQALADLVGSFRSQVQFDDRRGVSGEYFAGRKIGRRKGEATDRIDAQIDFDFGTATPLPELKDPNSFSIRWSGALLAAETGNYEFVVRTDHAARLWINDLAEAEPLLDAWVKSGDGTEFKAQRFLVGGRVYPLRLEFSKAKQGVDDSKKQKTPPPAKQAAITLLWKPPQGVLEPIPARHLVPRAAAEVYVCATPFPADDRSYGWERGSAVSQAWTDATTEAAIEAAGYVAARVNELAGTRDGDADRSRKLQSFCREFAYRAFRRPLDDQTSQRFVDQHFLVAQDLDTAVKRVVLLVLKSPRFLFRETGGPDQYDVAARLSFGLWNSIPDKELLAAAGEGRLETPRQVAEQATRMLDDPRGRAKLRGFLLSWLNVEFNDEVPKDAERFPDFNTQAIADMRTSLELFLDDVLWSESSDFRRLLLAEEVFLNQRLASSFGVAENVSSGFAEFRIDDGKRAGVLTHPYLLARHAHSRESSPIHRGVFLARSLLGRSLKPPPQAVTPVAADAHPELNTRERVTLQTSAANCMTCHGIINPLGFALEHFDAVGRYRELDGGKPVDANGRYTSAEGEVRQFHGARQLAEFVANSDATYRTFAESLFQHLVQQSVRAYGPETLEELTRKFAADEFNIRRLAVQVMVASAFLGHNNER